MIWVAISIIWGHFEPIWGHYHHVKIEWLLWKPLCLSFPENFAQDHNEALIALIKSGIGTWLAPSGKQNSGPAPGIVEDVTHRVETSLKVHNLGCLSCSTATIEEMRTCSSSISHLLITKHHPDEGLKNLLMNLLPTSETLTWSGKTGNFQNQRLSLPLNQALHPSKIDPANEYTVYFPQIPLCSPFLRYK